MSSSYDKDIRSDLDHDPDGDPPDVYFVISNAYTFRCLIEYLALTNGTSNFTFTENLISYSCQNDSETILNELEIFPEELTDYEYNTAAEKIVVGVDLASLKKITKNIGKKDRALFWVYEDGMIIRTSGSGKKLNSDGFDSIRTQRLETVLYDVEGYQEDNMPNFTEDLDKFSKVMSDTSVNKALPILVIGTSQGLKLLGKQSGVRLFCRRLGKFNKQEEGNNVEKGGIVFVEKSKTEIINYQIQSSIIAALSKLGNINPNGNVKVYIQPGLPIKFVFHVSVYGKLSVYVRGTETRA